MNKIAAILWCILSLAWTTASWAQNVAVSGKVTGANGEAIIGANVLVEGTTQGITTNVDGDYTLTNVPANATLVVSYLGYKTEKIPVGNKTRIDVTLREDTAEIEGVMVVAYGTAKKESFTGSAAVVKGGELQKRVVGNVTKSFEGTVAGVQVASGGGQPGEAASVIIRGIGSVNASATPLYVVDGIPFDGSLSAINPADIETMTVLKDASAGALYGARGANGVIVITTKKGKKDKTRISYKGNVGIASRAIPRYDLVDMKDYVEMSYEALRNSAQYGTGMDFEGASRYAAANLGQQIGGLKNPEYYNPYKNYTWDRPVDGQDPFGCQSCMERELAGRNQRQFGHTHRTHRLGERRFGTRQLRRIAGILHGRRHSPEHRLLPLHGPRGRRFAGQELAQDRHERQLRPQRIELPEFRGRKHVERLVHGAVHGPGLSRLPEGHGRQQRARRRRAAAIRIRIGG